MKSLLPVGIVAVLLAILGLQSVFTVDETQHRVVTRFGEVRQIYSTPGLKFKTPFVDQVVSMEKRLLRVDVPPASMPDADNQFMDIDAFLRYRIINPKRFLESLRTEVDASSRLGAIVVSELRAEVGQRQRAEIIGGQISVNEAGVPVVGPLVDESGTEVREALMTRVKERASLRVGPSGNDFGIAITDVRIKRADFPGATQENVFARMRTERQIQAQRLRAEGQSNFLFITAGVDRDLLIIAAEAQEKANVFRGQGEAEAIRILAEALGEDPEFYAFLRSLDAYKKIMASQTTVVLPADSPLFQYLQDPSPVTTEPTP